MRRTASKRNDVSVKAYAGTTGILLGMNIKLQSVPGFWIRPGTIGWSIRQKEWLNGMLPFPHEA